MGFWSKLGKIGLTIAPYVAAPFTGGASLLAAPAARAAVSKWNAKDAEKNAAKGLAPSKFDKILGIASEVGGMVGGAGGMGGLGKSFGSGSFTGNSGGGGWSGQLGNIMNTGTQAIQSFGGGGGQPQMQQQPQPTVDMNVGRRRAGLGNAFTRGAAQAY